MVTEPRGLGRRQSHCGDGPSLTGYAKGSSVSSRSAKVPKVLALAIGGFVCALFIVGCGSNTNPDTKVVKVGGAYVLMETEQYTGDIGGVGISSTLTLVDHCVGFGEPGHEVLAIFPPGTRVTGSGERMVIHVGDRNFRIGDTFMGGTRQNGDGAGGVSLSTFGDLAHQAPQSCRDHTAIDLDPAG